LAEARGFLDQAFFERYSLSDTASLHRRWLLEEAGARDGVLITDNGHGTVR
jgi:hypothetical protein